MLFLLLNIFFPVFVWIIVMYTIVKGYWPTCWIGIHRAFTGASYQWESDYLNNKIIPKELVLTCRCQKVIYGKPGTRIWDAFWAEIDLSHRIDPNWLQGRAWALLEDGREIDVVTGEEK